MFNRYKIVTIVVCVLIFLSFFTNTKASANTTHLNDLNNDSKVDILDVIELIRKLFNSNYTFLNSNSNPDINKDGVFSTLDAILLAKLVSAGEPSEPITLLKEGYKIGVVSFNSDQECTNEGKGETCPTNSLTLKQALQESFNEGNLWDIVGLQEVLQPSPKNPNRKSETDDFIRIMNELGKSYKCVKQQLYGNDFMSAICSVYPFIEGSYREHQIYQNPNVDQVRVVACVQVDSPAGILNICNTHPRAKSNPPAQFREAENYIFNYVLPSYIPNNILKTNSINNYLYALRAKTIITGDTNTDPWTIEGKFITACVGKYPPDTFCGVDQVMSVDMKYVEFNHKPPFNTQYLVSAGGYRDTKRKWPTGSDHKGPTIVSFITKKLVIN